MATPGDYLVTKTATDCNTLLARLEEAKTLALRISQRMESMGTGPLAGYSWPNDYTQAKFVALYQALDALPGLVVENSTRDKIIELVAAIQ